jgi:hypothetical protein
MKAGKAGPGRLKDVPGRCKKPPLTAECLDPGLEAGGLGKVKFRVRVEKI